MIDSDDYFSHRKISPTPFHIRARTRQRKMEAELRIGIIAKAN